MRSRNDELLWSPHQTLKKLTSLSLFDSTYVILALTPMDNDKSRVNSHVLRMRTLKTGHKQITLPMVQLQIHAIMSLLAA